MSTVEMEMKSPLNDVEGVSISQRESKTDQEKSEKYKSVVAAPEDNDGEIKNPKPEQRVSMSGTIVTIVKSCVGCGVLNMPITIQAYGIIPSIFVYLFVMGLTTMSIWFLMKCKEVTQRYGYNMYAKLCFGIAGTIGMKIILIFKGLGGCCVFLRTFGGVCGQIVTSILKTDDSFYFQENFYVFLIFAVLAPLMFMRDISGLKKFSFLGVVCIFIFVICIFIKYFYQASMEHSFLITSDMLFPIDAGDFPSLFQKLTSLINSYYFHMNVFPIYLPMTPRSSRNMVKATFISCLICSIIYYLVGVTGYAMYKNDLQSSILPNIKDDLQTLIHKQGKTSLDMIMILVNFVSMLTFFISALFTMPLIFFSLKTNLINLISMMKRSLVKEQTEKDIEGTQASEPKEKSKDSVSGFVRFVITLIAYCVVLFFTLKVSQIIIINSLAGSTVGNLISTIAPATFLLMLGTQSFCSFEKHTARFFIGFGTAILILFTKFQIIDVFFVKKE